MLIVCLLLLMLSVACDPAGEFVVATPLEQPMETVVRVVPASPTNTPITIQVQQQPTLPMESAEPDCPGGGTNRIGEAISDEYDFASYEDVMTWFCAGAEFEDIMVALQTEELTSTPAEELLVMLADGFTWEEIWLVAGLTD